MHDWSEDKYVRGLYSSPSVGAGWQLLPSGSGFGNMDKRIATRRTCRHDLASPIANTIFFAGEHTNLSTSATVQAAMETGVRAAHEVWNVLNSQF